MCQRQWFRSVPERGERRGILTTDLVASHFKQQFIISFYACAAKNLYYFCLLRCLYVLRAMQLLFLRDRSRFINRVVVVLF